MKKTILLAVWAIALCEILFFVSCSDPLESTGPSLSGPETLTDTIYIVDTLIVVVTDTTSPGMVCSRIASNQQEIVWMFRNNKDLFLLEFTASTESDNPNQVLSVDIDGRKLQWSPASEPELIIDQLLNKNAKIQIITKTPPARGHAIYVCLTISKP